LLFVFNHLTTQPPHHLILANGFGLPTNPSAPARKPGKRPNQFDTVDP
jgi:hypothetical protein